MVLDRRSGAIKHDLFYHILDYLEPGDVLVLNNTQVIPARLHGIKRSTGARVEILLVQREESGVWQALTKPAKRIPVGSIIDIINTSHNSVASLSATVLDSQEDGIKLILFSNEEVIGEAGEIPLPPYIHEKLASKDRYQTVFATERGSVAAPTAGLHFTLELLHSIKDKGIICIPVTLHVGLDTFRPVRECDPRNHRIHTEYGVISTKAANAIAQAKREKNRVIAVGTTVVRLLEEMALHYSPVNLQAFAGWVSLYILPGHEFQVVDALVTNFHLPRSSLLMLVSAFAGRETILRAYSEAIREQYRFYSFGDAMFIV